MMDTEHDSAKVHSFRQAARSQDLGGQPQGISILTQYPWTWENSQTAKPTLVSTSEVEELQVGAC